MKLAICGTRTFDSVEIQDLIMASWNLVNHVFGTVHTIYSGGANGVDHAAERVAFKLIGRKAVVYRARWDELGRAAGPARNERLARKADGLLLIWNGRSPGSRDVLLAFRRHHKPVMEMCFT